jgi:hypothetical protein
MEEHVTTFQYYYTIGEKNLMRLPRSLIPEHAWVMVDARVWAHVEEKSENDLTLPSSGVVD